MWASTRSLARQSVSPFFVGADAHIRPRIDVGIDPYNSTAITVSTSPATRNLMFTPP